MADNVEQLRKARQEKHVTLQALIKYLSSKMFTTQKALAQRLWPSKSNKAVILAEYMTGNRNGRKLDGFQLNSLHGEITFRLQKAGLPLHIALAAGSCDELLPPPTTPSPAPAPPSVPVPRHQPSALMILPLKDISAGHLGGRCLVMSLGAAAPVDDIRWIISARGQLLRIPLGYRARYTFGARAAFELGGRTFLWTLRGARVATF